MRNPEVIIIPIIFFSFIALIKIILDHRLKRLLIEKGKVEEDLKVLQPTGFTNSLNSMKWGMVLIGVGLAFLLHQLMPYAIDETGIVGMVALFSGIAFVTFHMMSRKQSDNQ